MRMYQSHLCCLPEKKFCEGIQNRLRFMRIVTTEINLHDLDIKFRERCDSGNSARE